MLSTEQITTRYGISRQYFRQRAKDKNVNPIVNPKGHFRYKQADIRKVMKGFVPSYKFTNYSKKIYVIETYFGFGTEENVSLAVGVSGSFAKNTIREWKQTGFITIKSKL